MSGATTVVLDRALDGGLPPGPPARGGEWPGSPRVEAAPIPPVSNARLGILAFIVFESMLFAGLLGGYTVERWGSLQWPPAGQPYLPIAITWLNTLIHRGSCVPLFLSGRALRRGDSRAFLRALATATLMGAAFLTVQGIEWVRLLAHGMTIAHGVYGGIFLILIGTHALHVLGAVIWLAAVALLAAAGRIQRTGSATFEMVTLYWYFVCAVCIALFTMVYLA